MVTVRDVLGGVATSNLQLIANQTNPFFLIRKVNPTACFSADRSSNDGELQVAVDYPGEFLFYWAGPNNFASTSQVITDLEPGLYYANITTEDGCSFRQSYSLCCCENYENEGGPKSTTCYDSQFGFLRVNKAEGRSPTSSSANDGYIELTISGAGNDIALNWTGPNGFTSEESSIYDLGVGTYCLNASDGCEERQYCYEMVDCSLKEIRVTGATLNSCPGVSVGEIELEADGGRRPYQFFWNDGSRGRSRQNLSSGNYCVTAVDQDGCVSEQFCFYVDQEDLEYPEVSGPNLCGNDITCRGIVLAHDPYEGSLNCSFENPNDCRMEVCRCPLTGGVVYANRHPYRRRFIQNCQLFGECPTGGYELIEQGDITFTRSVQIGFKPRCGCIGAECFEQAVCRVNNGAYLLGTRYIGRASVQYDAGCRAAGSGCLAFCGNPTDESAICISAGQGFFCSPPKSNVVHDHDVGTASSITIADALLDLLTFSDALVDIDSIYLPLGVDFGTPYDQYQKIVDDNVEELTEVTLLPLPSREKLEAIAIYAYDSDDNGKYLSVKSDAVSLAKNTITIQPNPASDYFEVHLPGYIVSDSQVLLQLFDVQGKMIRSSAIFQSRSIENTNNLNAGLYLLSLTDSSGKVFYTAKLIIR